MDKQKLLENFGINFKFQRMKLKMSQDDVAEKTNFSKAYISNIECAKHNISLVNALILCEVVHKNIGDMLKEF